MCLPNLNKVKRALKKDDDAKRWHDFSLTLHRFGYDRKDFIILERREMTYDMIQEHLTIRIVAPHPMFPGQTRSKAIPSIPDRFIPKDVFVMWSYEKRQDVEGSTLISTSRPFCTSLIDADKLYDRAAIDRMDNFTDLSVFEAGGGYWNDNGTIRAHCRHVWVQNLVRKK